MPCAAVQQLPHVRRGACDWTAGGVGGEMLWFHSVTVGGSVKKLISYSLESCELFFKRQIETIF
jgi:hypothetical protein